jgi:hypothetical protein
MFPIRPSVAANTITAKSPFIFVQYAVLDRVPDWVSEQVLEGVPDQVPKVETWCGFSL